VTGIISRDGGHDFLAFVSSWLTTTAMVDKHRFSMVIVANDRLVFLLISFPQLTIYFNVEANFHLSPKLSKFSFCLSVVTFHLSLFTDSDLPITATVNRYSV
jgi:hypothetical protein